jgi:tRNA nucleotidyltransferase/poly(A) polymerase
MRPDAPPAVRWITRTLEDAGFETWAVGGAVRDVLAGLPSGDWDLATGARPSDVRRLFQRTVPIGIDHGTVGVLARDGTMYEVTTFRRDVSTTGRHAVVEFADRIDDDLARRDFTINALAWHPLREELLDPFGGAQDLDDRLLRTVGEPTERFAEDYLRVLRALRFAGRFSLEIHPPTWRALVAATGRVDILSRERIREELMKVLGGDPRPARALALYRASGVLEAVAPELSATVGVPLPDMDRSELDVWSLAVQVAETLPRSRALLRLAALLQGAGIPGSPPDGWATELAATRAAGFMIRLRFSNAQIDRVTSLVRVGPLPPADRAGATLRRWLARAGPEYLSDLARLWVARARVLAPGDPARARDLIDTWRALRSELGRRPALQVSDLAIGGKDLLRMGMKPGPRFRSVLEELLARVLERPELNEPEVLAAIVLQELSGDASSTPTGPKERT